ncbi:MAG: site-specific integrase [Patescibacteria group bacterium]|nr:site-specific integrase [Patescibacteria group bacterium]
MTTEISQKGQPETFPESKSVARRGGNVAGKARKEAEKELGFRVTAYSIRRFAATKLYNAPNVSDGDVMQHMGHTRLSTTMRYVRRGCSLTDRDVEVMEKVF